MYLGQNLGQGTASYKIAVDKNAVANELRNRIVKYFNDPANFKLTGKDRYALNPSVEGWIHYPVQGAPRVSAPKGIRGDITGSYGSYYRLPNNQTTQQWVMQNQVHRLKQADIDTNVAAIASAEVLKYLAGKDLAAIAADLNTHITAVIKKTINAINTSPWFMAWQLVAK